ncbi:translation elongation factor Ts [Candidatus Profftia tarda]|uniref:Elongation factor Ts n=1 Tax=Candidatus Profftia tarda TaxID=1177216 RepID=A0A8E4F1U5_9ENTR|nr:translation elongation factor Ts [Candidatus Profftia tarda]CAD6510452.1 Elongation factor Ts [Candidatus Profftia tarda]
MPKITTILVKELRKRTAAGIMDCKKALSKAEGDIDRAIEEMRKSGAIKAAKKASLIATEGIIKIKIVGNCGVILEINCQTDFVAKDSDFERFAEKVLDTAFSDKVNNVELLKKQFEEERIALIVRVAENINIRRVSFLEGEVLAGYLHGNRIGVLVSLKGSNKKLAKQLAMHVAASNPEFIKPQDAPSEIIEKEYQLQLDIAINSGKKKEIAEKIVKGRMQKFTSSISLTGQNFVMDVSKTVGQILQENNAVVSNFIRFELGEGIGKEIVEFSGAVKQNQDNQYP